MKDEARDFHPGWNKTDRESKYHTILLLCKKFFLMMQTNLDIKRNRSTDIANKHMVLKGEGGR